MKDFLVPLDSDKTDKEFMWEVEEKLAPIFLAVFKLITSSNFVGRSTGRSAGSAPFRVTVFIAHGEEILGSQE